MIYSGRECFEELAQFGINVSDPDEALKKISTKINQKRIQLKNDTAQYQKIATSGSGKAAKRGDFNDQIALVSKTAGFHINKMTVTVAEYASYVKLFKTNKQNGKDE
jgi:P pilus assembly chaperone PapD